MDTRQIVRYWIKEAQEDIPVADHLFAAGDYTYSLFFCHLFIEKLLKALVVARTAAHAPPIHNLIVLSEKALLPLRPEQADLLRELMRFNIESRYPKDRESLRQACGRDYTREKLTASRELAQWLIEKTK
jgi:HEPN domain-containing protein